MSTKAVFLDRDGVLNKPIVKNGKPYPPQTLDEFEIIEGMKEGLTKLKKLGFLLIVVTNQPDVGRGTQKKETVEEFNRILKTELPIDDIFICYDDNDIENKKPAPGMLLAAAKKWNIDLKSSFMVGDRWNDIEAGNRAGCKTIYIDYKYSEINKLVQNWSINTPSEIFNIIQ